MARRAFVVEGEREKRWLGKTPADEFDSHRKTRWCEPGRNGEGGKPGVRR